MAMRPSTSANQACGSTAAPFMRSAAKTWRRINSTIGISVAVQAPTQSVRFDASKVRLTGYVENSSSFINTPRDRYIIMVECRRRYEGRFSSAQDHVALNYWKGISRREVAVTSKIAYFNFTQIDVKQVYKVFDNNVLVM